MARICIVGAGLSGAVLARRLSSAGLACLVVDERPHVAGNCHTEPDPESGVLVHRYGPHIFHTDDTEVWEYINRFADMMPYVNRVRATVRGRVYSLPINLHTINQFFGTALSPDEARTFVAAKARSDIAHPVTFKEQALAMVGEELYKAFLEGYTRKQWGMEPDQLPVSILKRLPLRFNYDDNYYNHKYQGMPKQGYTEAVRRILDCDGVEIRLNCGFEELDEAFDHVFYSGPIDRYFHHDIGRLEYRTLDFETIRAKGDIQGTAVMNYPDADVPYTRITEHKHFAPWSAGEFDNTVAYREYSRACGAGDIPYYPIRLTGDQNLLTRYEQRAQLEMNVTFVGRLGTYQYLDMDVTIRRALDLGARYLDLMKTNRNNPQDGSAKA